MQHVARNNVVKCCHRLAGALGSSRNHDGNSNGNDNGNGHGSSNGNGNSNAGGNGNGNGVFLVTKESLACHRESEPRRLIF